MPLRSENTDTLENLLSYHRAQEIATEKTVLPLGD